MPDRVTSIDGTEIAFDRFGTGPAVIVVGGALMGRQTPQQTVKLLAEDFTVYSYDRRGRGDSQDGQPYSVSREFEDLQAIIDHAGGSVRVFGMSSGSFIALATAAADDRVAKVVVWEPPYLTGDGPLTAAEFGDRLDEAIDAGQPERAVELFLRQVSGGYFDESMKRAPWWPGMVAFGPSLRYDAALTADGSVPNDMLERIKVPLLALYGGASDAWAERSARAVASAAPSARAARIDGQGHQVDETALAPVLIDFFRD